MTDHEEISTKVTHLTRKLQAEVIRAKTSSKSKPNLQWGQFIVPPKADAQVGVYGSTCAAILLRLNDRDDSETRQAQSNLIEYLAQSPHEAEAEFAHNIKLAMLVFALAPRPGHDAIPVMLDQLKALLSRCSTTSKLWPAYTPPPSFGTVDFQPKDAEVATAAILIFLDEIGRCLTSAKYTAERAMVVALASEAADALEGAFISQRAVVKRHLVLVVSAVLLVKGSKTKRSLRSALRDAVETSDFEDRRVYFYECLRSDRNLSRDYFIVPPAVVLPLIIGNKSVNPMLRARAVTIVPGLLDKLDEEGLFRGGQDMPSTVEQALVGLSLQAAAKAAENSNLRYNLARTWVYFSQPSPDGTPTKLVTFTVVAIWIVTVASLLGKHLPPYYASLPVLKEIYSITSKWPEAISQLLSFLSGALPASSALFLRIIGQKK